MTGLLITYYITEIAASSSLLRLTIPSTGAAIVNQEAIAANIRW